MILKLKSAHESRGFGEDAASASGCLGEVWDSAFLTRSQAEVPVNPGIAKDGMDDLWDPFKF